MFAVYRVIIKDDAKTGIAYEKVKEFYTLEEASEYLQEIVKTSKDSYTVMME